MGNFFGKFIEKFRVKVNKIYFFDTEIAVESKKILDIGAVSNDRVTLHTASIHEFFEFIKDADYVCGHNIVHHDLKYIEEQSGIKINAIPIDTLYLSPLLFPQRPYHRLLKDDKLQVDELNNPLNDSQKAATLFYEEINKFNELNKNIKKIYCNLVGEKEEFKGFFLYNGYSKDENIDLAKLIRTEYKDKICENANIEVIIKNYPVELCYALALIGTNDRYSITPPWVTRTFPKVENVIKFLCDTPCKEKCSYCREKLDVKKGLRELFGYEEFRTYNGEPLQEKAAQAAIEGKSLIAVFPTGGGKSITFQLPALMSGRNVHGLTVVIVPLQALMKDQVDNLVSNGIDDVAMLNGLINPAERRTIIERVSDGRVSILFISPEQLRSKTIERILLCRNIVRFVIDEAHCFSAWGQDFRVDYLYIGNFIKELQKKKLSPKPIPVSCFTATAKQKVITDIMDYFKRKLDLDLEIFASNSTRKNLHYTVLYKETEDEKYTALRSIILSKKCPTIVYVSRIKKTEVIARKLTEDGILALPFNGEMEGPEKIENQEKFMKNEVQVMVATSAFGMGVDKKDIKLVVHYDISDSLENYVQEAGRAGRDPSLQADCYVLFNDDDLDNHFMLLNQTKLSVSEIQQVWKAIKDMTIGNYNICCSPLEIARQAGWDSNVKDIETRVKTAIAALENAGYIKREKNVPRIYATGILARNMMEASKMINSSDLFSDNQREIASRIISHLISARSIADSNKDIPESRIDYIGDMLGIEKSKVLESINLMRQIGLLEDHNDMTAYINDKDTQNRSTLILERFIKLERFILEKIGKNTLSLNLKELNEEAQNKGITNSNIKNIRTILHYLAIKNYIKRVEDKEKSLVIITPLLDYKDLMNKFENRISVCKFIIDELFSKVIKNSILTDSDHKPVTFSIVGLFNDYEKTPKFEFNGKVEISDIEDAILYLSKIGAIKIQGGFLVLYNRLEIKRLVKDNRIRYKKEDFRMLDEFYKQKIQQIHIVGEYANLMVKDYDAALNYVQDYFNMDFKKFIAKYFKGERLKELNKNITPKKYKKLFGELSNTQLEIINDDESKYIVVAAGPGSGKTRVLVHKLASLLLLEEVKHEQLLMVTFSRAAATEFKKRLISLIGNAAYYVEIKTFHSYCFDLLGKIGNLEESQNVVKTATEMILNGEVEQSKIIKSVLVIDEAQDMDEDEYNLIKALMRVNDEMRVIAVGDDDQNIYEFRGSSSEYMKDLINRYGATKYEMTDNYRSCKNIVSISNAFVKNISNRMKEDEIHSIYDDKGFVEIVEYSNKNLEVGLVNSFVKNYKNESKSCILTGTNEEALYVLGLLLKKGIRAKLIQSLNGFRLQNLLEIRFFMDFIKSDIVSPIISDELWNKAKEELKDKFKDSKCLEVCLNLISEFEKVNRVKYKTDLEEFINESNYEDFYSIDKKCVFVSTIHKSKGREFDSVYILLKSLSGKANEEYRRIYVGMTRAKRDLHIHTNTKIFGKYKNLASVNYIYDNKDYGEPNEIMLETTHRDVFLSFFKNHKEQILKLHSGQELRINNDSFLANIDGRDVVVGKFSKAFSNKLNMIYEKEFKPIHMKVKFIVEWKGEEDEEETPIILADIYLKKVENKSLPF